MYHMSNGLPYFQLLKNFFNRIQKIPHSEYELREIDLTESNKSPTGERKALSSKANSE